MCNGNCVDLKKTEEHHDHACDQEHRPCHVVVMFKLYGNKSVSGILDPSNVERLDFEMLNKVLADSWIQAGRREYDTVAVGTKISVLTLPFRVLGAAAGG